MTAAPRGYSSVVAFGLQALAVAMRAKAGRLDSDDTAALWRSLDAIGEPDPPAANAVARFVRSAQSDPVAAGAALHDFLGGWRTDDVRDGIRAVSPHGWQRRVDCGPD